MTAATVLPRHARTSERTRRPSLREWCEQDHTISSAVLVPASLSGLLGLFLLGYALLFLG